jgi:hypothetical protein
MGKSKTSKPRAIIATALALIAASAVAGQITLYEHPGFRGRSMTTAEALPNLERSPFSDLAASVVVGAGTWEACTEAHFRGRCTELIPGNYGRLGSALSGPVASIRPIAHESPPTRVVISPDASPMPVRSTPAHVVISAEAPAVVVNSALSPLVVTPEVRPIVVTAPNMGASQILGTAQVVTTVPVVNTALVTAEPVIVLYQRSPRVVQAVALASNVDDLDTRDFEDRADAAWVSGGVWRLCSAEHGRGQCADFAPGRYENLGALDRKVRSAYLVATAPDRVTTVAPVAAGRMVLYQFPNYGGPSAVVDAMRTPDLDWANFRQPASSLRIESGTWLVCSEMGYQGDCRVLEPGAYPALAGVLDRGVNSARQVWRPEYGSLNLYGRQ